jgi:putative ABC transport system permease protein
MAMTFEAMSVGERVLACADMVVVGVRERTTLAARDLRDAARSLLETPIVSIVVVLAFAIGIGATTAAFSIVDAIVLRPLPYPQADRLVKVALSFPNANLDVGFVSPQIFDVWRARAGKELEMAEFLENTAVLRSGARPSAVDLGYARGDLFDLLGAHVRLGRGLEPGDARPGAARVIVLSEPLWRDRFGGDPQIVGRSIRVDDESYRVVGVAAAGIVVPYGIDRPDQAQAWLPLGYQAAPNIMFTEAIARVRDGVSFEAGRRALESADVAAAARFPKALKARRLLYDPLRYALGRELYPRLIVISLAVCGLFIVVCATIATMLLARGSARARSNAVRVALGATRGRIMSAVFAETTLLALAGGALGATLAGVGTSVFLQGGLDIVPSATVLAIDARVVLFAIAAVFLCALASALVPALTLSAVDPARALRDGERASTGRDSHARSVFVVLEIAIAVALVSLGALVSRSYLSLGSVDLGFHGEGLRVANLAHVSGPQGRASRQAVSAFENREIALDIRLLARTTATPGIDDVALAASVPAGGVTLAEPIALRGRNLLGDPQMPHVLTNVVSGGYFRLLGIPVLLGRAFDERDTRSSARVVLVDRAFTRAYLAGTNPVGTVVDVDGKPATIVGVVGDVRMSGPRVPASPMMYRSYAQFSAPLISLIVRSRLPQAALERQLDGIVRQVAPELPDPDFASIDAALREVRSSEYSTTILLGGLSAIALFLALAGVWGVVAYGVERRSHEFGIRLALGARPSRLVGDVVLRTARFCAFGVAAGIALACIGSRFVGYLLFGVAPIDVTTYALVAVVLAIVALGAAWVPARRASRVDPMRVLRFD